MSNEKIMIDPSLVDKKVWFVNNGEKLSGILKKISYCNKTLYYDIEVLFAGDQHPVLFENIRATHVCFSIKEFQAFLATKKLIAKEIDALLIKAKILAEDVSSKEFLRNYLSC